MRSAKATFATRRATEERSATSMDLRNHQCDGTVQRCSKHKLNQWDSQDYQFCWNLQHILHVKHMGPAPPLRSQHLPASPATRVGNPWAWPAVPLGDNKLADFVWKKPFSDFSGARRTMSVRPCVWVRLLCPFQPQCVQPFVSRRQEDLFRSAMSETCWLVSPVSPFGQRNCHVGYCWFMQTQSRSALNPSTFQMWAIDPPHPDAWWGAWHPPRWQCHQGALAERSFDFREFFWSLQLSSTIQLWGSKCLSLNVDGFFAMIRMEFVGRLVHHFFNQTHLCKEDVYWCMTRVGYTQHKWTWAIFWLVVRISPPIVEV